MRRPRSFLLATVVVALLAAAPALALPKVGTARPAIKLVDAWDRELDIARLAQPLLIVYEDKDDGNSNAVMKTDLASLDAASHYRKTVLQPKEVLAAVELYPEIPVALHLDHGNAPATCISAIDLGFTSVMMDGSLEADGKTPSSFEYNVAVTREVVEYAHARGVTVEGEIGTLGGIEDGHGSGE